MHTDDHRTVSRTTGEHLNSRSLFPSRRQRRAGRLVCLHKLQELSNLRGIRPSPNETGIDPFDGGQRNLMNGIFKTADEKTVSSVTA